jgi:beta-glucosidase
MGIVMSACSTKGIQAPNNGADNNGTANARMATDEKSIFINNLVAKMTLEEKVGQLNIVVGDLFYTGPTTRTSESKRFDDAIRKGELTGIFNIHGANYITRLQKIAVEESRLGIPLLIGADIIHGFKTVTPQPLAEAASWDMDAIEKSARVAARESAAAGINWTFAPMVDISRDPRWGRVSEGAGEDPFLGSRIAEARVHGFQGKSLADPTTIAACVKHFAAYGAPDAGRDYNTVDMSEQRLQEVYLPPYKAAIDAGAATVMTSFNELNGVPASGNAYLLDQILRKDWGFQGMVVSDWQSITEMIAHGSVADRTEATVSAIKAGTEMDMMSEVYLKDLPNLVKNGTVDIALVDNAVRHVLALKYDLGLFKNPYQYSNPDVEAKEIRSAENLATARDISKRSIVLLKNQNNVLPLSKSVKTLALIGPLGTNKAEHNGSWSFFGEPDGVVSVLEGIKAKVGADTKILTAEGADFYTNSQNGFAEAVQAAQQSDVVVVAVGESAVMNGEAASRSDIGLPGAQLALVKALQATGKPMVVVTFSGRPLELSWLDANVPAILQAWQLGSETGNAVADVLFGDYNPSGHLPATFPRSVGQIPIYYSAKATGRAYTGNYSEPASDRVYRSKYRDIPNSPLYPFGYGLSYTTFAYSPVTLSTANLSWDGTLTATVNVTNTGKRDGEEVVQLYIRDHVATITRPIKELKGFKKVYIKAGETQTITFTLTRKDLAFFHPQTGVEAETGDFSVWIGGSSATENEAKFKLSK